MADEITDPFEAVSFDVGERETWWLCAKCQQVVGARGEDPPCPGCGAEHEPVSHAAGKMVVTGVDKAAGVITVTLKEERDR